MDKISVFLHIPKTARSSIRNMLTKQYASEELLRVYEPSECASGLSEISKKVNESTRCISGHISYGIHEHITPDCQYFTMIRDPVSRAISQYVFTRRQDPSSHPLKEVILYARQNSILDFLENYPSLSNVHIRVLSGMNSSSEDAIRSAKNNVITGKIKFGLQEDFFRSVYYLFKNAGLKGPQFVWSKNTNSTQVKYDQKTIEGIREYCKLDVELYNDLKVIYYNHLNSWISDSTSTLDTTRFKTYLAYCEIRKYLLHRNQTKTK